MSRKIMNTIFLLIIMVLITSFSVGYSALNKTLTVSGDVAYYYNSKRLYDVLKNEVNRNTGYAREYTGAHQDSMSGVGSKKIYHWYASNNAAGTAIQNKFNVIFANHCWQMIRTTDTGGVKMIYNGEPENNQCLNTRGNHVGYGSGTTQSLSTTYYYGTSYTYDKTNNVFSLDGTITTGTINQGQYTCKNTSSSGTCSTLYLVEGLNSGSSYHVMPLNGSSHYSQFGQVKYNKQNGSLSDVGYMYNTRYTYNQKTLTGTETMLSSYSLGTTYWYADSVTWGSPTANKYNLNNPYQVSSTADYPSLVGKYTFRNATQTYTNTSVYYIAAVNGSTMYYISLSSGNNLAYYNSKYTYGDSYTDNGNGTYTINNPTTINRSDWYTGYSNVGTNKYVCKNATNNTCSELWYITSTSSTSMVYIKVSDNYKYANGFTYDANTGIYTLNSNSVSFWNINDSTNKTSLNNNHYTCWNLTGECTSISYIYYVSGIIPYYIDLTGGKNVETALEEMLSAYDVNQMNSTIKTGIDAWYQKYMTAYSSKLEDTIYCNNREIKTISGWDPNGGSNSGSLYYKESNDATNDLSCTNITDRFSTSNTNAKLNYPVGLMRRNEMNLLGNNNIRATGNIYWLGSPGCFNNTSAANFGVGTTGAFSAGYSVSASYGLRPAISLVPGIKYSSGNGSMETPYIVSDNISNTIFSESHIANGIKNVTIMFPSGCGTTLTCKYKKNNETEVTVTTSSVVVPFASAGYLSTTITDDDFVLNNSHTVKFNALYVSSSGNDSTGFGSIAAPYKTLEKAYDMSENTSTIYIMNNITQNQTFNIGSNMNLTLTSCTKSGSTCPTSTANSIIRGSSLTSNVINQDSGTLTLSTIKVDGNNIQSDSPMVYGEGTINLNSGTTLQNAKSSSDGGAIYSDEGTLNITDATITNNTAYRGGGVFSKDGTLTLNSGTIDYNSTPNSVGGGVWVSGIFNMSGGTINHNTAKYTGGVQCTWSNSRCIMTMSGGSISYNETIDGPGGGLTINSDGETIPEATITGGEISYNTTGIVSASFSGGAGINNKGKLTISNCNIHHNEAISGGGAIQNLAIAIINNANIHDNTAGYGGGINNTTNAVATFVGDLTINNITLSNNTATTTNGETGVGGGLVNNCARTKIKGGTISSNTSESSGGGVYQTYDSTFVNYNSTQTSYGKVTISGGKISNNTAAASGGGIYVKSASNYQNVLSITQADGTTLIQNNTAINTGGGIASTENTTFTLSAGTISGNKATTGNGYGGGLYTAGPTTISGGTISSNTARTYGGGWFIVGGSTATMSGGTITGNTATENLGGGIRANGNLTLSGGTISSNTANTYGGGISIYNSTVSMSGGTITANQANNGGGINNDGTFTMTGGTIGGSSASAGNKAINGAGGAIRTSGTATINQASGKTVSIRYNTSSSSGGGISNVGGTLTLTKGTINNNTGTTGGGVYASDSTSSVTKIQGITISNNNANTYSGGGIYAYGTLTMTSGTISNNTAKTYGGGVMCKTTCSLTGGSISSNTATTNNGGGIQIDGTATIGGTMNISSNSAGATSRDNDMSSSGTLVDSKASLTTKRASPYRIKSVKASKSLDVYGATNANGTNVQIYQDNTESGAQKWYFYPNYTINGAIYYAIKTGVGDRYLEVEGDTVNMASGSNIDIWSWGGAAYDNLWIIEKYSTGVYYIKNYIPYCVDVYDGGTANYTNVWLYSCNNTEAQRWRISEIT